MRHLDLSGRAASSKGGHKSASSRSHAERSAAAKKGWQTRRHQGHAHH